MHNIQPVLHTSRIQLDSAVLTVIKKMPLNTEYAPAEYYCRWNAAMRRYDPPRSASLWVVWLIGQLTASVLLLILSGFHFGLVRPDLCDSNATVYNNNGTASSLECRLNWTILAFEIIAVIFSVLDATANLHYLLHRVLDKAVPQQAVGAAQQAIAAAQQSIAAAKQAAATANETLTTATQAVTATNKVVAAGKLQQVFVDHENADVKSEIVDRAKKTVLKDAENENDNAQQAPDETNTHPKVVTALKNITNFVESIKPEVDPIEQTVNSIKEKVKKVEDAVIIDQQAVVTAQQAVVNAQLRNADQKAGDTDKAVYRADLEANRADLEAKQALQNAGATAQQAGEAAQSAGNVAKQAACLVAQQAACFVDQQAYEMTDQLDVTNEAVDKAKKASEEAQQASARAQQHGIAAQKAGEIAECKNGYPALCYRRTYMHTPTSTLRIFLYWILVHIILITIAANTYEWSWETDDLKVLINTAIFFFACIVYLLLIAGMLIWHGIFYNCKCTEGDKYLSFAPMLTIGLILSSVTVTIATLVVFFYSAGGSGISSSGRIAVLVVVLLYIIVTSTIWFILLSYSCLNVLLYENYCISNSVLIIFFVVSILTFIAFIPVFVTQTQNAFLLCIFIFPLLVCISVTVFMCLCKKALNNMHWCIFL